jgi:hypothetical protein
MQIPMGRRQVRISLERMGRSMIDRPELIEASDRELERIARTGSISREPRWEAPVAMLGIGMRN